MSGCTRRSLLALAAGVLVPAAHVAADEADEAPVELVGSRVRLATPAEARAVLTGDDGWLARTGPFQRRAVMGRDTPVTLDEFTAWNGEAARPWPAAQRSRWRRAVAALAPAFTALCIPLPPEVWLVASNGQESAGAPYTRAAAVVLPGDARMPGYSDAMLLAHELWHVAARRAPALASRLYAELGFEPKPPLEMPPEWLEALIVNPDAPDHAHAMRIDLGERRAWVMPVLVASRTRLAPGENFFIVMEVRLLEVEPAADGLRSQAVRHDGQPRWHPVDGPHDYLKRLGGNTGYVIHPEEALADNIALLATGGPARNAALLARLRAGLLVPRREGP